ncbi:MAG: nucleotidyltransferase domain-containing protein [Candidatus Sumerlaeota bacterium]|nr:nucleotidyltransferase domain-containing protein [Candidatus Sumerlaeota bacterium]
MRMLLNSPLEALRGELANIYSDQLESVILFGSQARGNARKHSDVDILVVLKGEVEPCQEIARTEEIIARISLQFDLVIECFFVSQEQYESSDRPFLVNARQEGVLV